MVTLAEELPFAVVATDDKMNMVCSFCYASNRLSPLSRCTGCHVLHYCSKTCQKKDWVDHKQECKFLVNSAPGVPNWMCRLISRIALKLKRGVESEKAAFNGRIYADLMDHRDEIQKDPIRSLFVTLLSHCIHMYMGEKYAPTPELIISIYGKIVTNSFDAGLEGGGAGLYLGLSVHNHSCAPDVFVIFDGAKAVLRSPNKDMKYSMDLTVSYIDVLKLKKDRQEKLSTYYFDCTCKLCSDPTMDFMYNSICSTCCPDSYCLLDPDAKELTCNKCEAVCGVTVKEAVAANEEANAFAKIVKGELMANPDTPNGLRCMVDKYEKFSKVLSSFNLNLMIINDRLIISALRQKNYLVSHKYGRVHLPACRLYIPVGDPNLTGQLIQSSAAVFHGDAPSKDILNLLEEALAVSLVSHGPNSFQSIVMTNRIEVYRMKLQLGRTL